MQYRHVAVREINLRRFSEMGMWNQKLKVLWRWRQRMNVGEDWGYVLGTVENHWRNLNRDIIKLGQCSWRSALAVIKALMKGSRTVVNRPVVRRLLTAASCLHVCFCPVNLTIPAFSRQLSVIIFTVYLFSTFSFQSMYIFVFMANQVSSM